MGEASGAEFGIGIAKFGTDRRTVPTSRRPYLAVRKLTKETLVIEPFDKLTKKD
jgi:hypothetical protein